MRLLPVAGMLMGLSGMAALAVGPPAVNLAPNPSLEKPAAAGDGPEGWTAAGAATWSDQEPRDGARCLRLAGGLDSCWVSAIVPSRPGETFLYSAWLRMSHYPPEFSEQYYLNLEFVDAQGQALPRSRFTWRPAYRAGPGWFLFQSRFFPTPPGTAGVRLILQEPRLGATLEADRISLWRVAGPYPRLGGFFPWLDLTEAVTETYAEQSPPVFSEPAVLPRGASGIHARVVSSFPGNVFVDRFAPGGLRLRIQELQGQPGRVSARWILTDWRGEQVAEGTTPQAEVGAYEAREIPLDVERLPRRGAYLLRFSLLESGAEVGDGFSRLALLPSFRRETGLAPESPWGINFGSHPLEYYAPRERLKTVMAQAAGARWCTVTPWLGLPLHDAEAKMMMGAPGLYEEILDLYLGHGISVRGYMPSYYLPDRPLTAEDLGPFKEWVRGIVRRLRGRVGLWYYGGEPQQAWVGAWGPNAPTPQQFFDQMKAARQVCRQEDPNVPFLTPTFAHYGGAEALRWAYDRYGATGTDFDGIQYNPYESAEGIGKDFLQIAAAHGDKDKGLYIGEIGLWAERNPASELLQAEYLVRKHVRLLGELPQLKQINWFCFATGPEPSGGMGMIEFEDCTPKPQWAAYAVMTGLLGERPVLAGKEEKNGAVCYRWRTPEGPVTVLWAEGHPGTAQVATEGKTPCTVVDIMGNATNLPVGRATVSLPLTSRPIYLYPSPERLLTDFQVDAAYRNPRPPAARLGDRAPAALAQRGVEIVPGPLGPAAQFSENGATLLYPVNNDLLWWHAGTLELWFRPDKPLLDYHNRYLLLVRPVQDTPFSMGPGSEILGGSSYLHLWVDGGFISAGLSSGTDRWVMFPQQREWEAGSWHQIVLTWTEREARLYLDGALTKAEQITPLKPFRECRLSVGSFQPAQEALEGSIGGLRTYSRAKPAEEIGRDYRAGLGGNSAGREGLLWEMQT